jgi:hypothetical protein
VQKKLSLSDIEQKINSVRKNPTSLFGEEIGTASQDGEYFFRFFFKSIEESKSGKAILGKLTAVMDWKNQKIDLEVPEQRYRYISGTTYIPKFALKNPLWVLEHKVDNSQNTRWQMSIDSSFVPDKYRQYNPDFNSEESPEQKGISYVDDMTDFLEQQKKESLQK